MIRQYYAQRARGGDNPLRVGTVAAGGIFYLQYEGFFRDRFGGAAVCRTHWQVPGFLNGAMGAARRNRDTNLWEDTYRSGRSDMALVRSLRDTHLGRRQLGCRLACEVRFGRVAGQDDNVCRSQLRRLRLPG